MRIVHNFRSFPEKWTARNGRRGSSVYAAGAAGFLKNSDDPGSVFVVNCDPSLVLQLAMPGRKRCPLIAVDIVLRQPEDLAGKLQLPVKRALLRRVDHFIHYFRDCSGLERVYGIGQRRSSYVPFKVNLISRHALEPRADGEYALCFGRSMRDFDTFLGAMERVPYPGAITRPDFPALAVHQGKFTRPLAQLPKNVRLLDDDRTEESEIRILGNAKLVVLPILKKSLVASGISTCLNAMFLGKCVIGSEGPGMSDIFNGEILTFPAENPEALAAVIRRAWEDDALREKTAAAGRLYAIAAGAEPELYQRIIDDVADFASGIQ